MIVQDATSFPVNPDLVGITKRYLSYMTETKLGIPPALLAPYLEGDASYLASLGASLNGYSRLCIDIEYLPTSPATIVWYSDSVANRATSNALRVDWVQKFRAGYTGELGFYGELPDFAEYARNVVDGNGTAAETAAYNLAYQYAVDMAPMIAECDVLYPSLYLDDITPGGPYERPMAERMAIFRVASTTSLRVLRELYPTKKIEQFINTFDLDARLSHLRGTGVTVNVWSLTNLTANDVAVMRYWNEIDNTGSSDMPKKLSEFDASLEATNPDGTIRIAGADGSTDVFVTVGTLVDRSIHVGQQTLDTIADAGALAAKNTAALSDIDPIAGQSILGNSAVSSAVPGQLTAAQARTLLNVADGATANDTDANLRNRANHTGTQPLSSVSGLTDALGTIDALSVTTDVLVIDESGTRYTVAAGADGTGPGGSGRALYVPNVSGTPSYGVVGITSGNIDFNEDATSTVSVARTTGVSGAVTVTWTVSPGTHTVTDTGTISWNAGEGGTKTFTLTGEQVATDLTGGTVSIAVTSGSATVAPGFGSVTIATRNVVVQTPGQFNWINSFPVGESGTNFSVQLDRSSGSDGAVAVDWTCTSGNHTTVLTGTETWAAGNSQIHTLNLTRTNVTVPTFGTLTLSNPRRTDGGSPAPTIGTGSTLSFGISPSTNAGTISLVSTAIDVNENTTLPIVLTRAGGSAGEAVARWTITGDTPASSLTGTITWAAGEFGNKSPTVLPTADFVPADRTSGVLTVTIVSGSATLQAPVTGTIAVRNVADTYTVANALAGVPFTVTPPTTPTTTADINITTGNVATYTGSNSSAANGRRLLFAAGDYGNIEFRGSDQEIILTTGVIINILRITGAARRIKITADPVRSGTIAYFQVSPSDMGSTAAQDIIIDGITQYHVNQSGDYFQYNSYRCQRLAILNSSFTSRNFAFVSYGGAGSLQQLDTIVANCELSNEGPTLGGGGTGGPAFRTQGARNLVVVDNRIYQYNGSGYQNFRIHGQDDAKAEFIYVSRNQFEGAGHAFQRDGNGGAPTAAELIENVWYVNNLQYCSYTGPPINLQAFNGYPTDMIITGNTLYSTTGDYPASNATYNWTVSGNTYSATAPTPPAWDFDTWRA